MGQTLTPSALDRAAHLRAQPEALDRLARSGEAEVIIHRASEIPITGSERAPALLRLPARELLERGSSREQMTFLGLADGAALFGLESTAAEGEDEPLRADIRWVDLVVASMTLSRADAALANYLVGLSNWRAGHAFCSRCGRPNAFSEGGHVTVCTSGHRSHPRVEPVVQMLVHDRERCLLGRSPGWPAGWFSTLAGFVEPGETPEQATVREVREEAGVEVLDVRYSGAQFWAGPYSLMLGYIAQVADVSPAAPGEELEAVRALTRDELTRAWAERGIMTPSAGVLAGALIESWLERQVHSVG